MFITKKAKYLKYCYIQWNFLNFSITLRFIPACGSYLSTNTDLKKVILSNESLDKIIKAKPTGIRHLI